MDEQMNLKNLLLVLTGIALTPAVGHANPSNCYSIQNYDRKNFCLATTRDQRSYCYSIGESDTKNYCLAQVGNQRSYCYSIRSLDTKNQCLAMVR